MRSTAWLIALAACSAAPAEIRDPAPPVPTATDSDPPPPREPPIEIIEPGQRVPSFSITTVDGKPIDSRDLVGRKPFVVLHFASWCKICDQKLPVVKAVLERSGQGIDVIGVAWDNDDSWDQVAAYVERHSIPMQLVRAEHNKRFAVGYDPAGGFPLLLLIDKHGLINEFQMGIAPSHEERLDASLAAVLSAP